jgi:hypothetical protein
MLDFFLNEAWPVLMLLWLAFYLPASLASCSPAWWFGRKRVAWSLGDSLVLVVPFLVWASLLVIDDTGKSWGNLWEAVLVGLAAPLAPILRIAAGNRIDRRLAVVVGILMVSLVGVMLWAWVPAISERRRDTPRPSPPGPKSVTLYT